ncbi:hypothetical protein K474DRAFT_672545 [Panus rudis PR-1116 ss-1]|nr:hypothetical protein K474DRAFT_672545 [Panus rudis PR-1116 ss-1]
MSLMIRSPVESTLDHPSIGNLSTVRTVLCDSRTLVNVHRMLQKVSVPVALTSMRTRRSRVAARARKYRVRFGETLVLHAHPQGMLSHSNADISAIYCTRIFGIFGTDFPTKCINESGSVCSWVRWHVNAHDGWYHRALGFASRPMKFLPSVSPSRQVRTLSSWTPTVRRSENVEKYAH